MTTYRSQLGQDKWIIEQVFPGKRGGFFVDIGAADGITLSNTYVLEREFGWQGICAEPGADYERLVRNRACITDDACVTDKTGEKVSFLLADNPQFSGIVCHMDCHSPNGRVVERNTKSLLDLLIQHKAPRFVEYISIDTEGSEFVILREFPFDAYTFGAITVEHNHVEPKRANILALLTANGYRRVSRVAFDDWYLKS